MNTGISLSSIGNTKNIIDIWDSIPEEYEFVEIAIGTRPDHFALEHIAYHNLPNRKISFHANFALDKLYNQEHNFDEIVALVKDCGAVRYSIHAPLTSRVTSWGSFIKWLKDKIERSVGIIDFSIETMYPNNKPYWLDNFGDIAQIAFLADKIGWNKPFIADLAHLQICYNKGTWTDEQICTFLTSGYISELHFSDNDGVHDVHKPYVPGTNNRIQKWLSICPPDVQRVDEGRRKKYESVVYQGLN